MKPKRFASGQIWGGWKGGHYRYVVTLRCQKGDGVWDYASFAVRDGGIRADELMAVPKCMDEASFTAQGLTYLFGLGDLFQSPPTTKNNDANPYLVNGLRHLKEGTDDATRRSSDLTPTLFRSQLLSTTI
jgi:hypothetical protein